MAYAWKKGYHARVSAQAAAEVCSDLEAQDALSSENLVEVSRPESAPLHGAFDWDDAVAGENWRKFQAGTIIRSLVIVSETDDGVPAEPVRAFFSIKLTEPNYESLHVIIRDQDKYADLLKPVANIMQMQEDRAQAMIDGVNGNAARFAEGGDMKAKVLDMLAKFKKDNNL